MIKIEDVNKICSEKGMTKMSISTYPTWVDSNRQEGIEFRDGKIVSFWIKDAQRIYGEPASDHITHLIEALENFKKEKKEEEKPKEPEKKDVKLKEKELHNEVIKTDEIALLPDFLTPALMTKWAKMSTIDRMLLFQRTPENQIFGRVVGKDGNGKEIVASYVKGNYMIREANAAFLFDWNFRQQGINVGTEGVAVYGIIEANVDGKTYTRPAVGYEEINKKMTPQLAIKSATTDAIKKGLSLFGFNSDVYGGEL